MTIKKWVDRKKLGLLLVLSTLTGSQSSRQSIGNTSMSCNMHTNHTPSKGTRASPSVVPDLCQSNRHTFNTAVLIFICLPTMYNACRPSSVSTSGYTGYGFRVPWISCQHANQPVRAKQLYKAYECQTREKLSHFVFTNGH